MTDMTYRDILLSKILHKMKANGEFSLIKFLKGGSDAITVLALQNDRLYVKKMTSGEFSCRLHAQYEWLQKQQDKPFIVRVLGEHRNDDYYAIDLAYNPENITLLEYIHSQEHVRSAKALETVWELLFGDLYKLETETVNTRERDEYVECHLKGKLAKAVMQDPDLEHAARAKKICINGEVYDNIDAVLGKIMRHRQAWDDIATYRRSNAIHGDLTIDNILIHPGRNSLLLIDPSDDNQICSPVIDLGRQLQSLEVGYEFLNNDEAPVGALIEKDIIYINYCDHSSEQYAQLCKHLKLVIMKKFFTPSEQRSALFHAGLFYARMLPHRIVINSQNILKYYAIAVILLNRFMRQYDGCRHPD